MAGIDRSLPGQITLLLRQRTDTEWLLQFVESEGIPRLQSSSSSPKRRFAKAQAAIWSSSFPGGSPVLAATRAGYATDAALQNQGATCRAAWREA